MRGTLVLPLFVATEDNPFQLRSSCTSVVCSKETICGPLANSNCVISSTLFSSFETEKKV